MRWIIALVPILLIQTMTLADDASRATVVSNGRRFSLNKALRPEGTTVLIFLQRTSTIEDEFLAELERDLPNDQRLWLRVVRLKDLNAPAARAYSIEATPTAIVYDRFARQISKTSQPDEIRVAVRKGLLMGRLKWIDEDDPKATETYGMPPNMRGRTLPGIVKTYSLRPDAFRIFRGMSEIHFTDGFLSRREHELIGAYVSALNKCRF